MCVFDLARLCLFAGRGVVVRGAHHAGRGDAVAARRRVTQRPDAACFVKNLGVCDERDCVIGEKQSGARACVSDAGASCYNLGKLNIMHAQAGAYNFGTGESVGGRDLRSLALARAQGRAADTRVLSAS